MKKTLSLNEYGLRIGEDHQNAKYTNQAVDRVLDLRDMGIGYMRIGMICMMPKSVVRDICTGRRRCQFAVAYKTVKAG